MSSIFTDSNVSTIANGVAAYSNMNNKGAANKSAKTSKNSSINDSTSITETGASDTVKKTKVGGKTIGTPELSEKAAKIPISLVSSMKSAVFRSQIVFWTRFPRRAKIAVIHRIHTNSEAEFLSVSAPRERRNDP